MISPFSKRDERDISYDTKVVYIGTNIGINTNQFKLQRVAVYDKLQALTEQYFLVVLFIMPYNVVTSFESVDEILKCDHSNESY